MPWQDCCLATDDFLVVRLMEVVVHADDLAATLGSPTPALDDEVLHPALALLAMLSSRRHGQDGTLRALARGIEQQVELSPTVVVTGSVQKVPLRDGSVGTAQ